MYLYILLQGTVSESTLVALMAARRAKILHLQAEQKEELDESVLNSRLVAYTSDQASFCKRTENPVLTARESPQMFDCRIWV